MWGDGTMNSRQSAAVDAYFAAGKTWDYFKNTFGRKGMRGNGQAPSVIVHYCKGRAEAEYDYGLWFGDGKDDKRPLTESTSWPMSSLTVSSSQRSGLPTRATNSAA